MGKVVPLPKDPGEKYTWKCKACNAKGKAATKKDAELALALHIALMHD